VDITLEELADPPWRAHGASFSPSTISGFFNRHGVTFNRMRKKADQGSAPDKPG
jgi:hypothetical protein